MARDDWFPVNIDVRYIEAIDRFLEKPEAKNSDISSRPKLIAFLLKNFFREYKDATGEDLIKEEITTIDDILRKNN